MVNDVIDILVAQGVSPQKTSSTTLTFSQDGLNFVFQADLEDDPSYFRLMLPDIEPDMGDMSFVYEKIAKVSSLFKGGKCVIINEMVWISVEGFSYDPTSLPSLIKRMINVLKDMVKAYRTYGSEQNIPAESSHKYYLGISNSLNGYYSSGGICPFG